MLIKNKPVTLTFFITLFQTMSTGVMFSLTVLYLTLSLKVGESEAYMLNTALFSLFYCLPLIAGIVADTAVVQLGIVYRYLTGAAEPQSSPAMFIRIGVR